MVFEMAEKGIREVRIDEYSEKLPLGLAWLATPYLPTCLYGLHRHADVGWAVNGGAQERTRTFTPLREEDFKFAQHRNIA